MSGPSREAIRAEALRIGFAACGFATLEPSRRADALDRWLAAGHAGLMRYLHRQKKKRKAPATITPGARSAVVLLENYTAPRAERPARRAGGKAGILHDAVPFPARIAAPRPFGMLRTAGGATE